jgi:hypothetical protein
MLIVVMGQSARSRRMYLSIEKWVSGAFGEADSLMR